MPEFDSESTPNSPRWWQAEITSLIRRELAESGLGSLWREPLVWALRQQPIRYFSICVKRSTPAFARSTWKYLMQQPHSLSGGEPLC
jgi:hypothetical protein